MYKLEKLGYTLKETRDELEFSKKVRNEIYYIVFDKNIDMYIAFKDNDEALLISVKELDGIFEVVKSLLWI